MTRWPPICLAVFGLFLSQGLGYADGSGSIIDSLPGRIDRMATSLGWSSSYLLTEIDDGRPTENQVLESGPEGDTPSPPSEKNPKSGQEPRSRSEPLKPMSPSEEIKADQAVDFPYNI